MLSKGQAMTLALIVLAASAVVVAAAVYYVLKIKGYGRLKLVGVEAYADPELTKEVSSIWWGEIPPGGHSKTTLWLKCTSTVKSNLTMHTEEWDPAISEQYMTMTWDFDGHVLQPNEVAAVEFTLHVADSASGFVEFSFVLVLTAAG